MAPAFTQGEAGAFFNLNEADQHPNFNSKEIKH
jgi:hypothetical protein